MIRTSSRQQQHTESSRQMRGAWKAVCEYIFELHTQRTDPSRLWRIPAHVIVLEYTIEKIANGRPNKKVYSKRQKSVNFSVNIRWYNETDASSFWKDGAFLLH